MKVIERVKRIVNLLEKEYHSPRHYNKQNPLNEFLFILLSLRTDERKYNDIYKAFKRRYPRWSDVYREPVKNIASTIYNCGLATQKAERLKKALGKVVQDFGSLSLKYLKSYDSKRMEKYLLSLPGVGLKTARCIMMYSFGRRVLPIDTHTYRISARIGFINGRPSEVEVHRIMEAIISPKLRYSYHVNCVAHGRAICKAIIPKCKLCIIKNFCHYYMAKNSTSHHF